MLLNLLLTRQVEKFAVNCRYMFSMETFSVNGISYAVNMNAISKRLEVLKKEGNATSNEYKTLKCVVEKKGLGSCDICPNWPKGQIVDKSGLDLDCDKTLKPYLQIGKLFR